MVKLGPFTAQVLIGGKACKEYKTTTRAHSASTHIASEEGASVTIKISQDFKHDDAAECVAAYSNADGFVTVGRILDLDHRTQTVKGPKDGRFAFKKIITTDNEDIWTPVPHEFGSITISFCRGQVEEVDFEDSSGDESDPQLFPHPVLHEAKLRGKTVTHRMALVPKGGDGSSSESDDDEDDRNFDAEDPLNDPFRKMTFFYGPLDYLQAKGYAPRPPQLEVPERLFLSPTPDVKPAGFPVVNADAGPSRYRSRSANDSDAGPPQNRPRQSEMITIDSSSESDGESESSLDAKLAEAQKVVAALEAKRKSKGKRRATSVVDKKPKIEKRSASP